MAFVEDFYEILHRIHSRQTGHLGYKKKPLRRYENVAICCNVNNVAYVGCFYLRVSSTISSTGVQNLCKV